MAYNRSTYRRTRRGRTLKRPILGDRISSFLLSNGKKALDVSLTALAGIAAACLVWLGMVGVPSANRVVSTMGSLDTDHIPEEATVVVIDAGHGGFDGGAVGTTTSAVEADLNLAVSKLLADKLTERGFYVIMTRSDENALAETKNEDMQARRDIMCLDCVDLVVSVHMNKFSDPSVSGPMVFYMKGSEYGKNLADHVIKSVCESLGRPLRYANPEDLFVLRVPEAPSVLVECGFLSNSSDEALLLTEEHQMKLANGIATGLSDYLAALETGDTE